MKYTVKTTPSMEGKIAQEMIVDYGEHSNIRETVFRSVMDTQEQQVREALIQLGWTPPKDTLPLRLAVYYSEVYRNYYLRPTSEHSTEKLIGWVEIIQP